LRVPNALEAACLRSEISEEVLLERMRVAFSPEFIEETERRVTQFRREGKPEMAETVLRRLREQMFDISAFMHMLKRRFSAWYNKKHGRKGTFWESRFRSVLVEDEQSVVLKMAAYIDLNAVRAGLVKDPKDYRWCGYAEAVAGKEDAREGILSVVRGACEDQAAGWEDASAAYRDWLYDAGCEVRDEEEDHAQGDHSRGGRCGSRLWWTAQREAVAALQGALFHRWRGDRIQGFCRSRLRAVSLSVRLTASHRGASFAMGDWDGSCSLRDLQREVIKGSG